MPLKIEHRMLPSSSPLVTRITGFEALQLHGGNEDILALTPHSYALIGPNQPKAQFSLSLYR